MGERMLRQVYQPRQLLKLPQTSTNFSDLHTFGRKYFFASERFRAGRRCFGWWSEERRVHDQIAVIREAQGAQPVGVNPFVNRLPAFPRQRAGGADVNQCNRTLAVRAVQAEFRYRDRPRGERWHLMAVGLMTPETVILHTGSSQFPRVSNFD
jgi:hypothetical protein